AGSVVMPCLLGLVSANLSSHSARGRQFHPRCNIPDFELPADAQLSSPSRTSLRLETAFSRTPIKTYGADRGGGRGQQFYFLTGAPKNGSWVARSSHLF